MISSTVANQQSAATSTAWQSDTKERVHATAATTRMVSEIAIPAKSERTDSFFWNVIWTQAVRLKEFKSIIVYIKLFVYNFI